MEGRGRQLCDKKYNKINVCYIKGHENFYRGKYEIAIVNWKCAVRKLTGVRWYEEKYEVLKRQLLLWIMYAEVLLKEPSEQVS